MPLVNVPFYIARRYFTSQRKRSFRDSLLFSFVGFLISLFSFSRKKMNKAYNRLLDNFIGQNFIKFLSNFSMVGVGIGTAALVVVMSVFNGLEDLTRQMFRSYNPELKVSPAKGKSFELTAGFIDSLKQIEGVVAVLEVIEDNALLRYKQKQKIVAMKGVQQDYGQWYALDSLVPVGQATLANADTLFALIGSGVQYELGIRIGSRTDALQFWYPRAGNNSSLNPEAAFRRKSILAGGVFMIDPYFDQDHVIVPLAFASELLDYGNQRTSLEVVTEGGKETLKVQKRLQAILGNRFFVETLEQQQAGILRALEIERIFAFVAFIFVLGIASFNIFFTLAMLVIEKKKDIAVLKAMGISTTNIRKLFLWEGGIIAFTGTSLGLLAGLAIVLLQQKLGLVSLGVASSVVEAYPVKLVWTDFAYTAVAMATITVLAAILPAQNASKTHLHEHL